MQTVRRGVGGAAVSLRLAFALSALTLALAPLARAQTAALPPLSSQDMAEDKAFKDAVVAARASLPVFWSHIAENAGGPDDYSLKVAMPAAGGGVEELWLSDIKRDGERIVGRLNYEPDGLPNMHRGQIVPIHAANIMDWTFRQGKKRYGHFTTRVLAKAHPEDAGKVMATLSDNPLPTDPWAK